MDSFYSNGISILTIFDEMYAMGSSRGREDSDIHIHIYICVFVCVCLCVCMFAGVCTCVCTTFTYFTYSTFFLVQLVYGFNPAPSQ